MCHAAGTPSGTACALHARARAPPGRQPSAASAAFSPARKRAPSTAAAQRGWQAGGRGSGALARTSGDHGPARTGTKKGRPWKTSGSACARGGSGRVSAATVGASHGHGAAAAARRGGRRRDTPTRTAGTRALAVRRVPAAPAARRARRAPRAPLMKAPGEVILRAAAARPPPASEVAVVAEGGGEAPAQGGAGKQAGRGAQRRDGRRRRRGRLGGVRAAVARGRRVRRRASRARKARRLCLPRSAAR
jgi:hypothetical protein